MRSILAATVLALALSAMNAVAATTYSYDTLGRLKQAKYDNGKEINYTYDQAGNRTSVVTQTSPPHGLAQKKVSKKTRQAH